MIFLRIVSNFSRNVLFVMSPKLTDDFPAVRSVGAETKEINPVSDRKNLCFVIQF